MKHGKCPHGSGKIVDSRERADFIYRVRACFRCKTRFSTVELKAENYDLLMANQVEIRKTVAILETTLTKLRDHSERLEKHEV